MVVRPFSPLSRKAGNESKKKPLPVVSAGDRQTMYFSDGRVGSIEKLHFNQTARRAQKVSLVEQMSIPSSMGKS